MSDPRSLLSRPFVYRTFQRLVAKRGLPARLVREVLKVKPGMRVLDIGCGPGDVLEFMPGVDYCGVDISESYIEAARARFGNRGRFIVRNVDRGISFSDLGTFDLIVALGLIHHLDDAQVGTLLLAARSALRFGGRLATFDNVFVPEQSAVARWIIARDRGDFIRSRHAYEALARSYFPIVETAVRHDLLRIPYTHIIMECRVN